MGPEGGEPGGPAVSVPVRPVVLAIDQLYGPSPLRVPVLGVAVGDPLDCRQNPPGSAPPKVA